MNKKYIIGTSYFPTVNDAILYYQHDSRATVMEKIKNKEIHIGRPELGNIFIKKENNGSRRLYEEVSS